MHNKRKFQVQKIQQFCNMAHGPVAQRITRLTTNQEIAGSNPASLDNFSVHVRLLVGR